MRRARDASSWRAPTGRRRPSGCGTLLELRKAVPMNTLAAQVVGRDGVPWFRSLTIDKGERGRGRARRAGDEPDRRRRAGLRGGPARRARPGAPRPRRRGGRPPRAQPGAGSRLRPGVGPGGGVRGPRPQVRAGAGGRAWWETWWSPPASTASTPRAWWSGACASSGRGSSLFRDIRVEPSARFDRLEEVLVVRRSREVAGDAEVGRMSRVLLDGAGPGRGGPRRDGPRLPRPVARPLPRPLPAGGRLLRARGRRDARHARGGRRGLGPGRAVRRPGAGAVRAVEARSWASRWEWPRAAS